MRSIRFFGCVICAMIIIQAFSCKDDEAFMPSQYCDHLFDQEYDLAGDQLDDHLMSLDYDKPDSINIQLTIDWVNDQDCGEVVSYGIVETLPRQLELEVLLPAAYPDSLVYIDIWMKDDVFEYNRFH